MEPTWFETNRSMWDERVPIHVDSDFYDVAGFRRGEETLRDYELEDVGDVSGLSLVHLQCHFGLDTLSWARRGATVTGLDFSQTAIEAARSIAADCDLPARFVTGNVYDAPKLLRTRYDIVYTGLGALCWLPDLERWADVVASLLSPGGMLYVTEFHPFTEMLGDDDFTVEHPYFRDGPAMWDEEGTYAQADVATRCNRSFEWTHPISSVIDTLLDRGFALTRFREMDWTLFARWPFLEKTGRDRYAIPDGKPRIPLMYAARFTLGATRP